MGYRIMMLMGVPWQKLSPMMKQLMTKFKWKMLKSQIMKLVAIPRKSGQNSPMENPSIMVLDFNDSKFSFQILNFGFPISNFGFQQIVMKKKNEKKYSLSLIFCDKN